MDSAARFAKTNTITPKEASTTLNNYIHMIKWNANGGDSVLDVGCGPGTVTSEVLVPFLPKSFSKLIGIDISQDMIDYATYTCLDPKISFVQMDVTALDIPQEFNEDFDHVFSFLCFHWIQDQRKALSNILQMLKPGGDMLLTFYKTVSAYNIYENLAKNETWKPYLNDFKNYISPYHYSQSPKTEVEKLLDEVGFVNQYIEVKESAYNFPTVDSYMDFVTIANPFYNKIPYYQQEKYLQDYEKEARTLGVICNNGVDKEDGAQISYKLFIAYASKKK